MKNKILISTLLSLLIPSIHAAYAEDSFDSQGRGFYTGAFGGAGQSSNQDVEQTGVANKIAGFTSTTVPASGAGGSTATLTYDPFDVHVNVKGKMQRDTAGIAGVHMG
jgi:hypothetical protein